MSKIVYFGEEVGTTAKSKNPEEVQAALAHKGILCEIDRENDSLIINKVTYITPYMVGVIVQDVARSIK